MNPHSKAVTNKLIAAMDGVGGRKPDVLFIAATNHPDMLDGAALRGGRFTEKVVFDLPDREMVMRFVDTWGKTVKVPKGNGFTAAAVASGLAGQSQSNITAILDGVVNAFIERTSGAGALDLVDLMDAKLRILGEDLA